MLLLFLRHLQYQGSSIFRVLLQDLRMRYWTAETFRPDLGDDWLVSFRPVFGDVLCQRLLLLRAKGSPSEGIEEIIRL